MTTRITYGYCEQEIDSGHKCPHCGASIPEYKLWHDPLVLMHTTRCDACGKGIRCITEIRLEAA